MTTAAALPMRALASLRQLGAATLFLLQVIAACPYALKRFHLVSRQVRDSGARSLVIIMTSGLFVGLVIGLQFYDSLSRLRQEDILGAGAALTLLKELGPVVTALLFAGRAGTSIASEIGLMRATDQLAAIEMMAIDPLGRVVAPRFLGCVISVPLLTAVFNSVGIFGAYTIGVIVMGIDNGAFWSQMQAYVELADVGEGVLKSCVFGVAAGLVAVFQGYFAQPTAAGVGLATTRTVVTTAVIILIFDYMITAFLL